MGSSTGKSGISGFQTPDHYGSSANLDDVSGPRQNSPESKSALKIYAI